MLTAVGSVDGDVRFYGLTETNMTLDGIDRHQPAIRNFTSGGRRTLKADHCVIMLCITPTVE